MVRTRISAERLKKCERARWPLSSESILLVERRWRRVKHPSLPVWSHVPNRFTRPRRCAMDSNVERSEMR